MLARGDDFADALAAAPFAGKYKTPIVFTGSDRLNEQTKKALQDWKIKKVILLGGSGAISLAQEQELKALGITVERIGGADRYQTSLAIVKYFAAREPGGVYTKAAIATGENYPDALAGAAFAAIQNCPVLLVKKEGAGEETINYLKGLRLKEIYIFGGNGAVSEGVELQLKS
jgi:putative cell wall-binding protein